MADKFPEIDSNLESLDNDEQSDFLAREKELLGDEFTSEQDQEILKSIHADDDDKDIKEFQENFPDVEGQQPEPFVEQQEEVSEELNGFGSLNVQDEYSGESQSLAEWKQRRDLEISKRDEIAAAKKTALKEEAQKSIDDFYDNYNNKKDVNITKTKKEEEEFLAKRDNFLSEGTVWDRVDKLVDSNEDVLKNGRDKTRFKALLTSLKGKENAPGAGGF